MLQYRLRLKGGCMNFLKKVLNINARESECEYSFPNYINSRYNITCAYLDEVKVFFLYPKIDIESLSVLKKHIEAIRQSEHISIVVVLSRITAREREKYIKLRIPFIVKDKQCYLPFMGTLLTERCDLKVQNSEKLMPSAQILLFYFIYNKAKDMYIKDVANVLGFSVMTISRAVKQLEQLGLLSSYKTGVKKLISSKLKPAELFEKARPHLSSPIKRKQYTLMENLDKDYIISGDSALSLHSMLSPPNVPCYATTDTLDLRKIKDDILVDDKKQVELEIWKYRPFVFKTMNFDVLSVVICYDNNHDMRIEAAKEKVLEKLWSSLNG